MRLGIWMSGAAGTSDYECISYAIKDGWLVLDGARPIDNDHDAGLFTIKDGWLSLADARPRDNDPVGGLFTIMWAPQAVDYVVVVPD